MLVDRPRVVGVSNDTASTPATNNQSETMRAYRPVHIFVKFLVRVRA